jgi:major membrane immunogen (membrane-anchored lipoprotein)
MKKTFISMMMTASFAVLLTACGGGEKTEATTDSAATETTQLTHRLRLLPL